MWQREDFKVLVILAASVVLPQAVAQQEPEDLGSPDPALGQLADLESRLDEIQDSAAYAPLFESAHDDIRRMQAMFTLMQKTVHDAHRSLVGGEPLDADVADLFHGALREYEINIEELEPNGAFGATKVPDERAKKKLLRTLADLRKAANAIPGLGDASTAEPSSKSTPAEAIGYARRSLTEVYWLLDHRTLTFVTSQGTQAARDLRAALDAVWEVLDESLDDEGNLAVREDRHGRPLSDQLAPFKAAMREARTQAEFYRKLYTPNVRRDAHRRRAERIEKLLGSAGFEKRFLAVKSLNEVPPATVASG